MKRIGFAVVLVLTLVYVLPLWVGLFITPSWHKGSPVPIAGYQASDFIFMVSFFAVIACLNFLFAKWGGRAMRITGLLSGSTGLAMCWLLVSLRLWSVLTEEVIRGDLTGLSVGAVLSMVATGCLVWVFKKREGVSRSDAAEG